MDFIYGLVCAFAVSLYIHRRRTAKVEKPLEVKDELCPYCGIKVRKEWEYCKCCDYPEKTPTIEVRQHTTEEQKKEVIEASQSLGIVKEEEYTGEPSRALDFVGEWKDTKNEVILKITPEAFTYHMSMGRANVYNVVKWEGASMQLSKGPLTYDGKCEVSGDLLLLTWNRGSGTTLTYKKVVEPYSQYVFEPPHSSLDLIGRWIDKENGQVLNIQTGNPGGWKYDNINAGYEPHEFSWTLMEFKDGGYPTIELVGVSNMCKNQRHFGSITINATQMKIKWQNNDKVAEYTKVVEPVPPKEPTITGTWQTKNNEELMVTDTQFLYLTGNKAAYNYSIAMDCVMLTPASTKDNKTHNGTFKYENDCLFLKWGSQASFTQYWRKK